MKKRISILAITTFCLVTGLQTLDVSPASAKTSEDDLVQNWGPWASLAPAAGGVREFGPRLNLQNRTFNLRPGQVTRVDPGVNGSGGGSEPATGPGNFAATHAAGAIVGYGSYVWTDERDYLAGRYVHQVQGNPDDGYTGTAELTCLTPEGASPGSKTPISIPSVELANVDLRADYIGFETAISNEWPGTPAYDADGNLLGYSRFRTAAIGTQDYVPESLFRTLNETIAWQPANLDAPEERVLFDIHGVVGYVSPIDAINAIALSDVHNISYVGFSVDANERVELDVDFGAATWSGQFVTIESDSLGFTAAGVVTGQDFHSTGFSENVVAEISTVNGSFYGPEVQGAGGIYDVTFEESDGGNRVIDAFITMDETKVGENLVIPPAPADRPN